MYVGCTTAPQAFNKASDGVYIGMEKRDFDVVMRPVNNATQSDRKRRSEGFRRNGSLYEIVYIRSGHVADGALTDDEYTPFLFQDGVLIGYGWTALGGKKTDSADIARVRAGATQIDIDFDGE
jgi:hypothetical protein